MVSQRQGSEWVSAPIGLGPGQRGHGRRLSRVMPPTLPPALSVISFTARSTIRGPILSSKMIRFSFDGVTDVSGDSTSTMMGLRLRTASHAEGRADGRFPVGKEREVIVLDQDAIPQRKAVVGSAA